MNFDAFFFDLDGTLYDPGCGIIDEMNRRIDEWILRTVPMETEKVAAFRHSLFERYGGTLPGLALEYGSDYYASMRYCHDICAEKYVSPNPELRKVLQMIPARKYVFTSSLRFYTVRVLSALGILDCFEGIIDAVDVYPKPKPAPEAFRRALQITAEGNVNRCVFLDDYGRNIETAHREGFFAVQVGTARGCSDFADAVVERVEDIPGIPVFENMETIK